MEIIDLYIFYSYSLSKPFPSIPLQEWAKTFLDLCHEGLSNLRTTYEKTQKNCYLVSQSTLPKRMKSPHPNFPSRHFLKLARLYLLSYLIKTICSKKRKGYWLLKPSLHKWINKASNGSSSLLPIIVFAFTSTESNQRNRNPADSINFPEHVLEGKVCVWVDTCTSEISKNTT